MESYHNVLKNMEGYELCLYNQLVVFRYIGRLRISRIRKSRFVQKTIEHFETFFKAFVARFGFSQYHLEVITNYDPGQNDLVAYVTFERNADHLDVLCELEGQLFNNKQLMVIPAGFTSTKRTNLDRPIDYNQLKHAIKEFNDRFNPNKGRKEERPCTSATAQNSFDAEADDPEKENSGSLLEWYDDRSNEGTKRKLVTSFSSVT
jgi:hypothetical protein